MTENTENTGEVEEKTLDKKDITYDILIDDLLEEGGERPDRGGPAEPPAASAAEPKGDHPAISILDMAVRQSGVYLRKQGLPEANNDIYESFSKPFLNTAAWHYLPEGNLPDDPRIALALGVAGLGLAFLPTAIVVYQKKEEEERRRIVEKKIRRNQKNQRREKENSEREEEGEGEEREEVKEEPAGPDWMERLEGGALLGI